MHTQKYKYKFRYFKTILKLSRMYALNLYNSQSKYYFFFSRVLNSINDKIIHAIHFEIRMLSPPTHTLNQFYSLKQYTDIFGSIFKIIKSIK